MALWGRDQLTKSSGFLLKPHLQQLLPCQRAWLSTLLPSHCTVKPEGRDHKLPALGLYTDRCWAGKNDFEAQKRNSANMLSIFSAKVQSRG